MALHILGHIKANQLNTQYVGQLPAHFGFTNTGRACKQETTNRLAAFAQTSPGEFDRGRHRLYSFILTKHHHLEVGRQVFKLCLI